MKGETVELNKLMQNKREEKSTPRKKVSTKERGKSGLSRKEKAKVSTRDIVATVQVQVAPKPGDYLFKATAKVITNPKAGENLFREVKKRGRPCTLRSVRSCYSSSRMKCCRICISS